MPFLGFEGWTRPFPSSLPRVQADHRRHRVHPEINSVYSFFTMQSRPALRAEDEVSSSSRVSTGTRPDLSTFTARRDGGPTATSAPRPLFELPGLTAAIAELSDRNPRRALGNLSSRFSRPFRGSDKIQNAGSDMSPSAPSNQRRGGAEALPGEPRDDGRTTDEGSESWSMSYDAACVHALREEQGPPLARQGRRRPLRRLAPRHAEPAPRSFRARPALPSGSKPISRSSSLDRRRAGLS